MIFEIFYFLLPAYVANMAPVFARKVFPKFSFPLDAGKKWHQKPLFGKNKTYRGLIAAIVLGTATYALQMKINIPSIINYQEFSLFLGLFLSTGAILGDLVGSFIKRRWSIAPGSHFPILDQIDFPFGALLAASYFMTFSLYQIGVALVLTAALTIFVNHMAFILKIRNEKW